MSENLKEYKSLSEVPAEERKEAFNIFVSPEGFFQCFMHLDRGPRELLGFLEQAKDVVKQYYLQQAMKQQDQKLVRPNGIVERFKKRWS